MRRHTTGDQRRRYGSWQPWLLLLSVPLAVLACGNEGPEENVTSRSQALLGEPACSAGMNVITGTEGDDVLTGTNGEDCIVGLGGNDVIHGGNGRDVVYGGAGDDQLIGGNGDDELSGGPGNDTLEGERGTDLLQGDEGNDLLQGGNGDDTLAGGPGDDTLTGGLGGDSCDGGDGLDFCSSAGPGCETESAVRQCSGASACDDGDPCTVDDCNPELGCISVHAYGPECPTPPPPNDVTIVDFSLWETELHRGQHLNVLLTLDAAADHPDYQLELTVFPTVPDAAGEMVGTALSVPIFSLVSAGSHEYPVDLAMPSTLPAGEYELTVHEYPDGAFVSSSSTTGTFRLVAEPVLPLLSILGFAPSPQQALLVDPESTVRLELPSAYLSDSFSGGLEIIARNQAVGAVPLRASLHVPGAARDLPLMLWDDQQKRYVDTLSIASLPANTSRSLFVEVALSEPDAQELRPLLAGQVPLAAQITFTINQDGSVAESACPPEAPDAECRHSVVVDTTVFLPASEVSPAPMRLMAMAAEPAAGSRELSFDKSYWKFAQNNYIGAGLSFGAGARLSRSGFYSHAEAAVPLMIFGSYFNFASVNAIAEAPLDRNALLAFNVDILGIPIVNKTIDQLSYTYGLEFPLVTKEKASSKTFVVACVPFTVWVGARGTFGVKGSITASSSLGAANAAALDLAAGPYADLTAFGGAGVGVSMLGYKVLVGVEVNLSLVNAQVMARGGGALDVILDQDKQPLAIHGGLHESLDYEMNFLSGNVAAGVWVPFIKWCKRWGIPYPCGVTRVSFTVPICSWPGYTLGPYTLLSASQDLFQISLATCGDRCGLVDDGCGGTLDCGGCSAPDTCGGGGVPNRCGCTPTSCEGKCGVVDDGCGGTLDCAGCTAPATCGGGGTPNVCGVPEPTTAIAAGNQFSCALKGGAAYCWGNNACGQLGDGTTEPRTRPVPVQGLESGVTAIAVSPNGCHACAIVNGAAKCWGDNGFAQLGNGNREGSTVPIQPIGLESGATAIGVGGIHTCAVTNGSAKCWGDSTSGALGIGDTASWIPAQVVGLAAGVQAITAGIHHTCAVVNGGVWCWGWSNHGELGNGFRELHNTPVQVTGLPSGVTALSAGAMHSCAVVDGGARCWGFNLHGELGSTADGLIPAQVTGLTAGVQAVGAGYYHTCAAANGSAWCWGSGLLGELGNGSTATAWSPVEVSSISGAEAVSAGNGHTCAVAQGIAYCWGDGALGQLGNGSNSGSLVPTPVVWPQP